MVKEGKLRSYPCHVNKIVKSDDYHAPHNFPPAYRRGC